MDAGRTQSSYSPMTKDRAPTPPPATRTEALMRLQRFVPLAGRDYAARRNFDMPAQGHPHVSQLSPYIRHRLITETEVLTAILGRHSLSAAEKSVQEVVWRTYWKGWLEQRPEVWTNYRTQLARLLDAGDLSDRLAGAEAGQTGIDCFDAWMAELTATGYLHNHARMWAASIWIFTLRLPWEAGADLFLRHLLDGDPASNTLSWRWVAGLQTPGKHYIATPDNIARYTEGRFAPKGLVTGAPPLSGPPHPPKRALPADALPPPGLRSGILLTEEDLSPGFVLGDGVGPVLGHAALISVAGRSPLPVSDKVQRFTQGAMADARTRWVDRMGQAGPTTDEPAMITDWASTLGLEQVITAHAPTGPAATALDRLEALLARQGIALVRRIRPYDQNAWPHATAGFFRFKDHIPDLVRGL
jgi:deoxyribodipyrimidine photo-lyase